MSKYRVKFPVISEIEIIIETDTSYREYIKDEAVQKAIEEQPLIPWLYNDDADFTVEAIE